jgi:general secretion pathway protein A
MYETFFGLSGKPFQLNPDPEFYFASKGHKRARAYLEYGLHQGEGFIVITGDIGAGKTTLVRSILDRLPGEMIVATHIVSTQVEADDLLRLVAQGFGMETAGTEKSALLTALRAYCLQQHELGRRSLLIIDEAQNLPPCAVEELRMLSNFQVGNQSLVQSFLIGQPELRDMLQSPGMQQLKQRIIASYHLGPLVGDETRAYVEHRLRHVEWAGNPAFDDEAFIRIHEATDGVPRRINRLCDRLLLNCYLAQLNVVPSAMVGEVANELARELVGESRRVFNPMDMPAAAIGGSVPHRRALLPTIAAPAVATESVAFDGALTDADMLADLLDRMAVLEAGQEILQVRLKQALRQLQRISGGTGVVDCPD